LESVGDLDPPERRSNSAVADNGCKHGIGRRGRFIVEIPSERQRGVENKAQVIVSGDVVTENQRIKPHRRIGAHAILEIN
jgi:hypothetical protein